MRISRSLHEYVLETSIRVRVRVVALLTRVCSRNFSVFIEASARRVCRQPGESTDSGDEDAFKKAIRVRSGASITVQARVRSKVRDRFRVNAEKEVVRGCRGQRGI